MDLPLCCLLTTVALLASTSWMKTVNSATLPSPTFAPINPDHANDTQYDDDDDEDRRKKFHERLIGGVEWPDPEDKTVCTLRTYDADKELDTIRQWHDLIKTPVDEATALRQLLVEACEDVEKFTMCNTFLFSRRENKPCVSGLTNAECLAVTMYSAEVAGGFYREFNNASSYGVWAPYRVYTSLLYSAIKKLAAIEPVPLDAKRYRGMRLRCHPPDAKRIFWKTFTSTTLDEEIAELFGSLTSIVFEDQATLVGARIKNLSLIEMEDEVLIPPFEIFDFLKADKQTFHFSSSKNQELLHDETLIDSHHPHDGSCAVQVSLVAITLPVISVIVSKSPF